MEAKFKDYMSDDVQKYYIETVKPILEKLKVFIQAELDGGYQLIVFGGFIRDVISKIDIDELMKKDIDIFINTENVNDYIASRIIEELSCEEILSKYFDNIEVTIIDDIYLGYYSPHYPDIIGRIVLKIDNINFDISINHNDNEYRQNTDYLCNAVGYAVEDDILYCRHKKYTLDTCIHDIEHKQLTPISVFDFDDWKHREEKMKSYGYQYVKK